MRSIPVLMVLGLGCAGCHQQIYVGPELPEVSPRDVRIPETRKPLNLEIACSFGEELLPNPSWRSEAYRAAVRAEFSEKRCAPFSSIVQEVFNQYASIMPAENVDRLAIKLNVRGEQGFIFPSFGGVTMEAEFTPVGRPPVRHEYKGPFYFGFGRGVPTGARPVVEWGYEQLPALFQRAEERVVRDMALNLVRDLQQGGEL